MNIATASQAPGVRIEWPDTNAQQLDTGRTDVAGFLGIAERGPLHTAVKLESMRQFRTTFGAHIERGCLAYGVEGFFANGGRTCWVVRVADPAAGRAARLRVQLPGGRFVLEAISPGKWGDAIEVQAQWGPDGIAALLVMEQERSQHIELAAPNGMPPLPDGSGERTLLGVPAGSLPELSPYVLVRVLADQGGAGPVWTAAGGANAFLAGGLDGRDTLRPQHFSGGTALEPPTRWGIEALELVDEVAFIAAPDLMLAGFTDPQVQDVQIAMLAHCVAQRDRVALLDLPQVPIPDALALRDALPGMGFGALYYPWIAVADPLGGPGDLRTMPPSALVAGIVARCDRLRGVHKPPANELLEGVSSVSQRIDGAAHAQLNEAGINAIRAVPGRGVLVLGARTLDGDPAWRYLNVRRLFNMIEEALEAQMQWLTFEPNNPRLWKEMDRAVRGFLERLYRAGMLDGATSDAAYSVRCDASTNPPSSTDEGRAVCLIGIQPPYPAEFVVVRVGLTRSGIETEQKGALDG
jgi:phage tail sheath protein FI